MGEAGSGNGSGVQPAENSSGWEFNWSGLVAVVLIVAIVVVAWRWLGGNDDASSQIDASEASVTTNTVEAAATTTRPAPTTTRPPTTTEPATTTTTGAGDREVIITGEMKACRFGANCLVAGFTISGFDPHPGRFICIYPNSQSDFSFNNTTVIDACITADEGDTITIEVDGVRSLTISEANLDGE
ncbi:hypothetical protein [Ilumatobacter sp.]|uniref:hypothetical protein n=1 Tax=Ilumatobacter sp. TaxID=1967498 RepID=UPI003AF42C95